MFSLLPARVAAKKGNHKVNPMALVISPNPPRRFVRNLSPRRGFSLVEVVLAVGVVAFAFVAILGLIPAGLTQFRQAMDTSVCAQIAQRVIMDAQQTDFETLVDGKDPASKQTNMTFRGAKIGQSELRYFDEQGDEIVPKTGTTLSAAEKVPIVYHVNTRIRPQTTLPRKSGFDSPDIATVTVQV